MCTERKIQQGTCGKSYASHSVVARMAQAAVQHFFWWGRSQGAVARPSSSNAPLKMVVSTTSSPTNQQ